MSLLVMKFGGTSVGSKEAILQAASIVKEQASKWDQMIVVVSAMKGVTNNLIQCAKSAADANSKEDYESIIADIQDQHNEILYSLLPEGHDREVLLGTIHSHIEEMRLFCRSIRVLGEVTPRGMDAITSYGERMNARSFSAQLRQLELNSQPVDATQLITTDKTFQNAVPLMDITTNNLNEYLMPMLQKGIIPVVTGFIGSTENGITTTLGRGGSDYTSAILGACLNADEVWTWTDVDGVMTADPRIVPDAKVIHQLSFNQVSELAYFGAKVLHPKTIRPIIEREIPLWVKNTFNPSYPGTQIKKVVEGKQSPILAITTIKNVSQVTVEGRGMLGIPGIAARTFGAVARQDASVLMISQASSEQSICFTIPTTNTRQVIESLEEEMALELMRRDIDKIWAQDKVDIVTIVGEGFRNTPGLCAKIFGALGKANINVIAIAQGSSDYSMSIVVAASTTDDAIRSIHKYAVN
jgi:aspartate kinase